jgi:hypothetical protein
MSEILNMSFVGSGFLEISKQQNSQNMNKFKYLMKVWITTSINIKTDYTQVINGGKRNPGTQTKNRHNWNLT